MAIKISEMVKPALIAGILAGVLSGAPFIGFLNILCCLWIVAGGVLAVYLLKKQLKSGVEVKDGAIIGALMGVFAAVVSTIVGAISNLLLGSLIQAMMYNWISSMPGGGAPTGMMGTMYPNAWTFIGIVIGFVFQLIIYPIFGAIGGVIGAKIFEEKK